MPYLTVFTPNPRSKDVLGPINGKGVTYIGEVEEDTIDLPCDDDPDDEPGTCHVEVDDDDPDLEAFDRGLGSCLEPARCSNLNCGCSRRREGWDRQNHRPDLKD